MPAHKVAFSKECSQVNFTATNNTVVCIRSICADRKLNFFWSILHSLYVQSKVTLGTGTKICS